MVGGLLLSGCLPSGDARPRKDAAAPIPTRLLGRTGRRISVVGMGGLVLPGMTPDEAAAIVAESVARGVSYFDVAPTYGDAEALLGPALEPFRDRVFLACKTTRRDAQGARSELATSLERLRTDRLDLYQLHGVSDVEKDVVRAFAPGGAMEVLAEAKKAGTIRFLGFSAHSPQAALAAMARFDFDTILYPVNFACDIRAGFSDAVLAEAKKRGMGILALKAMALQRWPKNADRSRRPRCWYQPVEDPALAAKAVAWTLSRGPAAFVPPGDPGLYRMALDLAPRIGPLSAKDRGDLAAAAAGLSPVF